MANYSAISIANWFLERAAHDGEMLTNLKIQKLLHIANGWHLHFKNELLFPDRIEAWFYGPVIPSVYRSVKHFGADRIEPIGEAASLGGDSLEILEEVWKSYGCMSSVTLIALTRKPDSPWSKAYENGSGQGREITRDIIKTHYDKLANDNYRA